MHSLHLFALISSSYPQLECMLIPHPQHGWSLSDVALPQSGHGTAFSLSAIVAPYNATDSKPYNCRFWDRNLNFELNWLKTLHHRQNFKIPKGSNTLACSHWDTTNTHELQCFLIKRLWIGLLSGVCLEKPDETFWNRLLFTCYCWAGYRWAILFMGRFKVSNYSDHEFSWEH